MKNNPLPITEAAITSALLDLVRAAAALKVPWALVGGQALRAFNVPREMLDVELLLPPESIFDVAVLLVERFD